MKYLFAPIPLEVLADRRLKLRLLRVLLVLFKYVNRKRQDRSIAWPSRKVLSRWTGYPPKVITQVTSELQRLGWLRKVGNGGFSRSARYVLATSIPGSAAEAIVQQMTKRSRNDDEGVEDAEAACDGAKTKGTSQGQNEDLEDSESVTKRSSNRGAASPLNEEGQRTDRSEQKKKRKEEQCARDRLAHTLVSFFLSSFRGLGFGVTADCNAKQLAAWCEDILALIDDGVSPDEIYQVVDWLLHENREREFECDKFPFVVHNPTDLRKKWPRIYEAASKDRDWTHSYEGSLEFNRIKIQRRYVEYLVDISIAEVGVEEADEDEIRRTCMFDERNRIPPDIVFCFCMEHGYIEGVDLVKAFVAAARERKIDHKTYQKVFPRLSQARFEELRSLASDIPGDQAAGDREDQEARDISWNGGIDVPGVHDGGEDQDAADLDGDEDDDEM